MLELHFCASNTLNSELEYVINRLSHRVSVIALRINPKTLGLIMVSGVDTSGDNQNTVR